MFTWNYALLGQTMNRVGISHLQGIPDPYNDIERLKHHIIQSLVSAGYGMSDPANPFKDILLAGQTVVLKPNWVYHNNRSGFGMDCMITNPSFIEAVVDLISKCNPQKIIIGDAPIQGCNFNALVTNEWIERIKNKVGIPLEIIDFRRTIMIEKPLATLVNTEQRDMSHFISFDAGKGSYLESISDATGSFRVSMYNHRYLAENHKKGVHRYLIAKEPLEADVFINLPKLKTHNKAGLTGALKNLVGINGSKEFLPHHRIGGTKQGGDNYPGKSVYKYIAEKLTDRMNSSDNSYSYQFFRYVAKGMLKTFSILGKNDDISGGWYGNDTVWRMVLDLNKIFIYGNLDGTFSPVPLRKIYSLTDAIIAGDHNGPLYPQPVNLGIITFSDSSPCADLVHAAIMGFDWEKIPVIRESIVDLIDPSHDITQSLAIFADEKEISFDKLKKLADTVVIPAPNWIGHIG